MSAANAAYPGSGAWIHLPGFSIAGNLYLDTELNKRIGKVATAVSRLGKRVWDITMPTSNTKIPVYNGLVYLAHSCTAVKTGPLGTCSRQERRINTFHMRCLRKILNISWQDRVSNNKILVQAGMPIRSVLVSQRRLGCLGHVSWMDDGRIPKSILYGKLTIGSRPPGRPHLRYKYILKRNMKDCNIKPTGWEAMNIDSSRSKIQSSRIFSSVRRGENNHGMREKTKET